jgi:hypothetical protein
MLVQAFVGFVAGILGTIVWEFLLKPRRIRRNIARLLEGEVAVNLRRLVWAKISAERNTAYDADLKLSTGKYESLGETIGELPPAVWTAAIEAYFRVDHISELKGHYLEAAAQCRKSRSKDNEAGLRLAFEVLNGEVNRLIQELPPLQAELSKCGADWWTRKHWKAAEAVPVDYEHETKLLGEFHAENERLMDDLFVKVLANAPPGTKVVIKLPPET